MLNKLVRFFTLLLPDRHLLLDPCQLENVSPRQSQLRSGEWREFEVQLSVGLAPLQRQVPAKKRNRSLGGRSRGAEDKLRTGPRLGDGVNSVAPASVANIAF